MLFLVTLFYSVSCSIISTNEESTDDILRITDISQDIDIDGDNAYTIDNDISNAEGSIYLRDNSILSITNAAIAFELSEDLEFGIYLEDGAKILIENSTITSNGKMWEFELRDNSRIDVTNSSLLNHSAVKLFDASRLDGKDSLIEELRMDNEGVASIDNCEIYPNMQFFFSVSEAIVFPLPYVNTDFIIDNKDAWMLEMINSIAQGWQVDVYPGTTLTIRDSKDVNLGLRSNGQMNDILYLNNPHDESTSFVLDEFGFNLTIENTEIYYINLYLKQNDQVTIYGEKVDATYNTTFLEIVLLDNAEIYLHDSHIFAQLFHANNTSKVTLYNSYIGSTDAEDPINSEFGIKNSAIGYAENSDFTNSDILITDLAILTLKNCQYEPTRVDTPSDNQFIVIQ